MTKATERLIAAGSKIVVDDVGAGYASMNHVLNVRPQFLKMDVGLTRSIDTDDMRVALMSAMQDFASRFSAQIVAEGVETREELDVLQRLGIPIAQGYLLGRPDTCNALLNRLEPSVV